MSPGQLLLGSPCRPVNQLLSFCYYTPWNFVSVLEKIVNLTQTFSPERCYLKKRNCLKRPPVAGFRAIRLNTWLSGISVDTLFGEI
jgi:hypothetical protein